MMAHCNQIRLIYNTDKLLFKIEISAMVSLFMPQPFRLFFLPYKQLRTITESEANEKASYGLRAICSSLMDVLLNAILNIPLLLNKTTSWGMYVPFMHLLSEMQKDCLICMQMFCLFCRIDLIIDREAGDIIRLVAYVCLFLCVFVSLFVRVLTSELCDLRT